MLKGFKVIILGAIVAVLSYLQSDAVAAFIQANPGTASGAFMMFITITRAITTSPIFSSFISSLNLPKNKDSEKGAALLVIPLILLLVPFATGLVSIDMKMPSVKMEKPIIKIHKEALSKGVMDMSKVNK